MDNDELLKDQIFEIIDNQLKANDHPEAKLTYKRLMKEGYSDSETRQMMGACIALELFEVISSGKPYNDDRYTQNLRNLPKKPQE